MANGKSVLGCGSASVQRCTVGQRRFVTIFHIFSTEAHHINLYILPEGILSTCSLRETYRLNTIQLVAVIYIQNKEKNHICNANSMDVCLCAA